MNIKFPYHFNSLLQTEKADQDEHIRDMIEQVLFTNPGERVNRPDFGCGLLHLVFEPLGSELVATSQFLIQSSLMQWMGDLIEIKEVSVMGIDSTLRIRVIYLNKETQQVRTDTFVAPKT